MQNYKENTMKALILLLALSLNAMALDIGVVERVKSVTANYSIAITDDNIVANATSGNITLTLPNPALKAGKVISVMRSDSSANVVNVSGGYQVTETQPLVFVSTGTAFMLKSGNSKIRVKYNRGSAQTIPHATDTIFNYDTMVTDTSPATVTTGASWRFTSPKSTCYIITLMNAFANAGTNWDAGDEADAILYVNGTGLTRVANLYAQTTNNTWHAFNGSTHLCMKKNDYFDIRLFQSTGGSRDTNAYAGHNHIEIAEM